MKRPLLLPCILFLLTGLLLGGILPMPWDKDTSTSHGAGVLIYSSSQQADSYADASTQTMDSIDNQTLLNTAYYVLQALKNHDYAVLASMVHPQRGVTCTPLSTISPGADRVLTQDQVKNLTNDIGVYTWGTLDEQGTPISMTIQQYFAQYVFDTDYTRASLIGIDQIMISGNALENISQVYSDCRFVDFSVPGRKETNQGLDWRSLKLVFQSDGSCWYLVAMVHGQWTG